jgi:hypothetical protein
MTLRPANAFGNGVELAALGRKQGKDPIGFAERAGA